MAFAEAMLGKRHSARQVFGRKPRHARHDLPREAECRRRRYIEDCESGHFGRTFAVRENR